MRFGVLMAAGLLAIGLGPKASAQPAALEKPDIALAVGGSVSQMNKVAYVVALQKGYFKDEGLNIDSSNFSSGTAALQALVGGSADVAELAYEHTLRMQTKNVSLTCLIAFGPLPRQRARRPQRASRYHQDGGRPQRHIGWHHLHQRGVRPLRQGWVGSRLLRLGG